MRTFPPCPSSPCPRAPQPSLGRWELEEPPGCGEGSRQALPRLGATAVHLSVCTTGLCGRVLLLRSQKETEVQRGAVILLVT